MPPVDSWKDWPLQQNALLQLLRRKRIRRTLIQPAFNEHKCIFVHVPKAAGTSVKKALFPDAHNLTHYRAIDYFLDNPVKYCRYFVFSFTRNPYDRLVSAYNYLSQGGKNEADRRFRDRHLSTYKDFHDFVKHGLRHSEIQKTYHFVPQYRFLINFLGEIMVDYLGQVETIEQDFYEITKKVGINANLTHTNKSKRRHYSECYTEETRSIAYSHYRRDFDLLNYDPFL